MNLNQRIEHLGLLGDYIAENGDYLQAVVHRTEFNNKWFTKENQNKSLANLAQDLNRRHLSSFAKKYQLKNDFSDKTIGLVLSADAPLEGFHDIVCAYLAGYRLIIKPHEADRFLLPHLVEKLQKISDTNSNFFALEDKLVGFDAVIAYATEKTAKPFSSYFKKYPHLIHYPQKSVAVLTGTEHTEDLKALGSDIFSFFGLSKRNVSKIFVPKGYNFTPLAETLHEFNKIVLNNKYKNNFDYNFALFQLNNVPIINNGAVILKEDSSIFSRIAVLHYEYYDKLSDVESKIIAEKKNIYSVISPTAIADLPTLNLGTAHHSALFSESSKNEVMDFIAQL